MDRATFIANVIDEVSEGGAINLAPKPARIEKIIKQAKDYFYQNNPSEATQTEWLVIKNQLLQTDLYKERRQIKMPECVRAIRELKEGGGNWLNYNNNINPDYRKVNFSYFNAALSGNTDMMISAITHGLAMDFIRSNFTLETISFSYSGISKMLNIEGRTTVKDLIASAAIDIPEEKLMESNQFFRYVVALCRKSIGRLFSITELKLLGRSGFNVNEIMEEGKEELKDIRDEIKEYNDNDVAFFMVDGRYIGE